MSLQTRPTREELLNCLAVARGDKPADTLIRNIRILDLVNGGVNRSAIVIAGNTVAGIGPEYESAQAVRIIDAEERFAVPGFIDAHLHIESSLMHPFEFERLTLPLGTTTAICDPHEITNVLGADGFEWFLRASELTHQNLFVQVSSCVPALDGFETNGGSFKLDQMTQYRHHPNVLGLAEMMNFPGVIHGDSATLDKLDAFGSMNLDGHSPLLQGKALNAYLCGGIRNCHETVTIKEGQEKLAKGMTLIIREGTVAKNLKTLAPLVTEFNSSQCLLCTDDRSPIEIFEQGHINHLISMLIRDTELPVHVAYRLATFSPANHFGLKRLGLIAPGKQADIVLLDNLESVAIHEVFIKGEPVSGLNLKEALPAKLERSKPPLSNSIQRETLSDRDFHLTLSPGTHNVIGIIPDQIITDHLTLSHDGTNFETDDVLKIAVVERYGNRLKPSVGLVKGAGLKRGAMASTVAHDSHNMVVIGTNDVDMALACNELRETGGGFCVVDGGKLKALLPLPVAGLVSLESAEEIVTQIRALRAACAQLGSTLEEPFLQMAFLALPVIPNLKITDQGLVDVSRFEFIGLRQG